MLANVRILDIAAPVSMPCDSKSRSRSATQETRDPEGDHTFRTLAPLRGAWWNSQ